MTPRNTARGWIALLLGIAGGFAALGAVLWIDDGRLTATAMGASLLSLVLGLGQSRRRRCVARGSGPGAPG